MTNNRGYDPTLVKFHCSICAHRLGITRTRKKYSNPSLDTWDFELLAMGWSGEWLSVNDCPGCHMKYSDENLEWRYSFKRSDGNETEIPF